MTREKDDPEKRNLLMEQKEDKKRRQYSGSRTKTDRRSCDTSSSEHRKRGGPYKTSSVEQRAEFKQSRTQSLPFPSEKKDSWWFWQNQDRKKQTEDTCSCVSCALKRFVSSEYACVGCLLLLFTISIIVAFLVVFKSVPNMGGGDECKDECKECKEETTTTTTTTTTTRKCRMADSERLKRKIEMLNENRLKNDFAGLDEFQKADKKGYDDGSSGHIGIPGVAGIDFGPSFRELNSLEESESKLSNEVDWSNVLDSDKNNELQSSDKLREFYKKLVQTDAQIKNLKRINQGDVRYIDDDAVKSPERTKRSLKLNYPKGFHVIRQRRSIYNKHNKVNENSFIKRRFGNKTRLKRLNSDSEEPTGFLIEKKKLLVQYKPAGRKKIPVKKCSHAPKDSHTHEKQLNHPFYKNTQRLDELLDKFLNRNLPEIMNDPFGLDMLFKHDKPNKLCKHPKPLKNVNIIGKESVVDQIPKPRGKLKKNKEEKNEGQSTSDLLKMLRPESTTQYEKDFYHHEIQMIGKEKQKIVTASPNDFEVLLSVSTIMNPDLKRTGKIPVAAFLDKVSNLEKVPNMRRLMQLEVDVEEDNLGYEDFKEVLTDDMENHDEMDKTGDRKKRMDDQSLPLPPEKFQKYNPPGVHNPNWKGPMPLYPDEINSMIRHSALNATKMEFPTSTNQIQPERFQRRGRDISDVEYVEDYLKNKYDKLVEMAQAYSDYGVLDGKKDSRNEKHSESDVTATDHRVKLSADEAVMFKRLKKGRLPRVMTNTAGSIRKPRDISSREAEETTEQTASISNAIYYTRPFSTEGIRIELCPTTKSREDDVNVLKILSKHVKLKPSAKTKVAAQPTPAGFLHSTLISSYPEMELIYSARPTKPTTEATTVFKSQEEIERENGLIFALSKGKRNLLSTDFQSSSDFRDNKDTTGYRGGNTERNRSNIDKFVQNLNLNRYNATNEKALAHYIERIKQKNIRIYSTPHLDINNISTHVTGPGVASTLAPMKVMKVAPKTKIPDTIITINKSEIKLDDYTGNNFLGKILLTVENPDIGVEHINLMFDVPLVINFNDELMMMNDNMNFPNIYNQFEIFTETTIDLNERDFEPYVGTESVDIFENKTFVKRNRREPNVTTSWSNDNATEENTITPVTSANSNSSVSLKTSRSMNSSETDNMTLSDFFSMVSDWFSALEGMKIDKPRDNTGSDVSEILITMNRSDTVNVTTTDSVYPLYDSDMIENIGHRSRVLLAIDDNLANMTEGKKVVRNSNATTAKTDPFGGNVFNITNSSTPVTGLISNVTTSQQESDKKTNVPKRDNSPKVKAIFKRNAEDSNLIFWNDIYDDEYGIQMDKLDNSIRDKHSVKENDFIKRSGRWVHDKIKKFAENLKINPHTDVPSVHSEDMDIKERVPRSVKNHGAVTYPKYVYDRIYDRVGRQEADDREYEDYDIDQKSIFTSLSANMKEICKKAAKAVQQARNMDSSPDNQKNAHEDSRQGSIAAALMQQLVRLLTDLVDYQVQQKTCTKLPSELQSFLEWLTYPKEETPEPQPEALTMKTPYPEEDLIEELQEMQNDEKADRQDEMRPGERQGPLDVRTHYIDCLHSIQDLLEQYEDMNDDEKSKMTGVKGYLENQMRFLNKEISGVDLFSLLEKHAGMRNKRDLYTKKQHSTKHRPRRKLNRFIKNFGKKHTRTTASYYDGVQVTDMKKKTVQNEERIDSTADHGFDEKLTKRNLKDVYYKAVAEAKKYATVKNIHKKDEITHFESTTVKMHQSLLYSFTET